MAELKDSRGSRYGRAHVILTAIATGLVCVLVFSCYACLMSNRVNDLTEQVQHLQSSRTNTTFIAEKMSRSKRQLADSQNPDNSEARVTIDCQCCQECIAVGPPEPPRPTESVEDRGTAPSPGSLNANDCIVSTEDGNIKVEGFEEVNVGTDLSMDECKEGCYRQQYCGSLNYNRLTRQCILYRERLSGREDCHRLTGGSASNWIYRVNRCAGQTEGCISDKECQLVDTNSLCDRENNICYCGTVPPGYDGRCGTGAKVGCPETVTAPGQTTTRYTSTARQQSTNRSKSTESHQPIATTELDLTYTPEEITTSSTPNKPICAYKTLRGAATRTSKVVGLPIVEAVTFNNMAECQRRCNDHPRCNAVNFRSGTGRCELLSKFVTDLTDCHVLTGDKCAYDWTYRYKDCVQETRNPACSRHLLYLQGS